MCTDCWGKDSHFPKSFKWHAIPYWEWLNVNPILFSQSLTVLSQILTPVYVHLVLICFDGNFLFSRQITLNYLFWYTWCLSWSTRMSSFFNHRISFIFTLNLHTLNNQHLSPHSRKDCLLEWVLPYFPLFQLTVILWKPCFLSIRYVQPFVAIWKSYLLIVDWLAYEGFLCLLFVQQFCWYLF